MGAFGEPKAVPKSVLFSVRFFLCGGSVTYGGREVGAGSSLVKTATEPPGAAPFLSKKGSYNDPRIALDCFLAFLALEAGLQGHFARDDGKSAFRPNDVATQERSG